MQAQEMLIPATCLTIKAIRLFTIVFIWMVFEVAIRTCLSPYLIRRPFYPFPDKQIGRNTF